MSERTRKTDDGTYPNAGEELAKLEARAKAEPGYDLAQSRAGMSDPPRAALAYITRGDGFILCVWNKHDQCWGLPGGREEPIDFGRLDNTLRRELMEEIGLRPFFRPLYDAAPDEPARVSRVHIFETVLSTAMRPTAQEPGAPIDWIPRTTFLKRTKHRVFYETFFAWLDARHVPSIPDPGERCTRCGSELSAQVVSHLNGAGCAVCASYVVAALATGWFCPLQTCGVWNGDAKVFLTECRACQAPRPQWIAG